MKKIFTLTLSLVFLVLTISSCGGQQGSVSSFPDTSYEVNSTESTPFIDESGDVTSETSDNSSSEGLPSQGSMASTQNSTSITRITTSSKPTSTKAPTTVPTKDNGGIAVTELAWDFMQGKGGAEEQAVAMRKAILQSKDTLKVTGTKYYFSENGDDTNDGKSPETALKSLKRIARLSLKAGDAVLLERGSTFRIEEAITLINGVSYGAYGTGDKPEILGSIKNYGGSNLWTKHTTANVWKVSYAYSNPGSVVVNDGELVGNREFSLSALNKNGDFFCDGTGVLYFYCDKDPNKYASIEIPCGGNIMVVFNPQNIVVENICMKYAGCHGIGTLGGNNVTIRNCVFGWIGGQVQDPSGDNNTRLGNAIEFYNGASNLCIENNWIYQVYDAGITFQGDSGPFKNIRFSNNLIEYAMMGIEFWCRNHNHDITDISIDKNMIRFSNYGWGTMPDRSIRGAHIWCGWTNGVPYENLKVAIKNNIFDCSYSFIVSLGWVEENGYAGTMDITYEGNTYYQRNHVGASNLGYGGDVNYVFFFGNRAKRTTANNQSELETAVQMVEPKAKLVKWLK